MRTNAIITICSCPTYKEMVFTYSLNSLKMIKPHGSYQVVDIINKESIESRGKV